MSRLHSELPPPRWNAIARLLTIGLIAGNTLTIRQEITGTGPEIRLGYLFSIALIIWVWWFGEREWHPVKPKPGLDKFLLLLVALLILSTISGVFVLGVVGLPATFYLAVGVICLYSTTFITLRRLYTVEELLALYLKIVKWAVLAAGIQTLVWVLFKWDTTEWVRVIGFSSRFGGDEGWFVRVTAWWQEPAHFAEFLLLGVLLSALPLPPPLAKKLNLSPGWRTAILATFAFTFATSAMPVVLFILLAYATDRRRRWALVAISALVIAWVLSSGTIEERLLALQYLGGNQGESNLSVWAIVSNFMASANSLAIAPLGLGVGNHPVAYDAWLNHTGIAGLSNEQLYLNARDAGSMIIRLLTEFGWPSLMIWIYLVSRSVVLAIRGQIRSNSSRFIEFVGISAFLTMCLRQGSYSLFDPWFFLLMIIQARSVFKGAEATE